MNATFQFKSRICTKETYPYSFYVTFTREVTAHCEDYKDENELSEIIFKSAFDFENIITKGLEVVDKTTEIEGFRLIHDARNAEMLDLARLGIERVKD